MDQVLHLWGGGASNNDGDCICMWEDARDIAALHTRSVRATLWCCVAISYQGRMQEE